VVGTFEWNRLALNVTYRPFSVNDLKLARRVQQACAIWVSGAAALTAAGAQWPDAYIIS